MENTCLMYALSFGLFCHASEQPNKQGKSLMDEYNDSFKPQLETKQERRFGRGSSGAIESSVDVEKRREELSKKMQEEIDAHFKKMEVLAREYDKFAKL